MKNKEVKNWYGFQVFCKLYEHGISNRSPPSRQQYCSRASRDGTHRPSYDPLHCSKNVCPILKGKIEMNEQQRSCL